MRLTAGYFNDLSVCRRCKLARAVQDTQLSKWLVEAIDSAKGIGQSKRTLLQSEIKSLKQKCAIEPAPHSLGFYARVFLVPKKNGKQCPVFNMKLLNYFLSNSSFKMATLKMVASSLRVGDFAALVDPSDAYFHVNIMASSRRFLSFRGPLMAIQSNVLWPVLSAMHFHQIDMPPNVVLQTSRHSDHLLLG